MAVDDNDQEYILVLELKPEMYKCLRQRLDQSRHLCLIIKASIKSVSLGCRGCIFLFKPIPCQFGANLWQDEIQSNALCPRNSQHRRTLFYRPEAQSYLPNPPRYPHVIAARSLPTVFTRPITDEAAINHGCLSMAAGSVSDIGS